MAELNPYVGPRPFVETEHRFFFGRAEEVEILTSLAVARRASLLFAQSGAGKSSLLRAGLTPRLLRHRRLIRGRETFQSLVSGVRIARVGSGREEANPQNIFVQSALLSVQSDPAVEVSTDLTLSDALATWLLPQRQRFATATDEAPLPFLLVFDQFEELFTRHTAFRHHREPFFKQVTQALADHECLRVLFSMREDYIAELTPYAHFLPDQLRPRFRLERLKGQAALDAITRPADRADVARPFETGVAEALLNNLQAGGADDIEPILLQVVCKRLWQNLSADAGSIRNEDMRQHGDVDRALMDYYNDAVETVVREVQAGGASVGQRRVRRFFSDSLLTPARTRALVYRDDVNGVTAGLPNGAIDILSRSDVNIIRGEARGQSRWYELSHDRLIPPVLAANEEWTRNNTTPLQRRLLEWTSRGRLDKDLLSAKEVRAVEDWQRNYPDDSLTPLENEFLQRSRQGLATALALVRANIDELGWAVLFADDDPMREAIRRALGPLLEQRGRQTRARFTRSEYAVKPGEKAQEFLKRHGALARGVEDADRMPYYLLIVGDPERIPFEFQYALDAQYAVGRLHFEGVTREETLAMYARYARSVVEAESGQWGLPRQAVIFGPRHEQDPVTAMLARNLIEPMIQELSRPGLTVEEWRVTPVVADVATKGHLLRLLGGDRRPALLVVAAHGTSYPKGHQDQYDEQGSIVCADWQPNTGPLTHNEYLAGRDVPDDASLLGMLVFTVVGFSAGTPKLGNQVKNEPTRELSDRAFVSRLSQRLLGHPRGGVLAVIGHVDTSWSDTLQEFADAPDGAKQWKSEGSDTFIGTVSRLVRGFTVGSAMDFFNTRYAQTAAELVDRLLAPTLPGGFDGQRDRDRLINEAIDVRNYIVLGDPAVRVPVEGPVPEQPASITIDPADVAAIAASLTPVTPPPLAAAPEATTEWPVGGVGPTGETSVGGPEDTAPAVPAPLARGPSDAASARGIADRVAFFNGIDFASGQYAYATPTLPALVQLIVAGPIEADPTQPDALSEYRMTAASYFERGV